MCTSGGTDYDEAFLHTEWAELEDHAPSLMSHMRQRAAASDLAVATKKLSSLLALMFYGEVGSLESLISDGSFTGDKACLSNIDRRLAVLGIVPRQKGKLATKARHISMPEDQSPGYVKWLNDVVYGFHERANLIRP